MDLARLRQDLERHLDAPLVCVFVHATGWIWCATEEQEDGTYFGFVVSPLCPEGEWGYFSRSEPESVGARKVPLPPPVWRN